MQGIINDNLILKEKKRRSVLICIY